MSRITLRQAVEARDAVAEILKQPKIPAVDGWRLARLAKKMREELATYDGLRTALLERLGTPLEDGGSFQLDAAQAREFLAREGELLDQEIDLPEARVKLADIGAIAPGVLLALDWIIDDGTAPESDKGNP